MGRIEIDTIIPFGELRFYMDGRRVNNVESLEFSVDADSYQPKIKMIQTHIKSNELRDSRVVADNLSSESIKVRIESDGTIQNTFLYIDNEKQLGVKFINLKFNSQGANKLETEFVIR